MQILPPLQPLIPRTAHTTPHPASLSGTQANVKVDESVGRGMEVIENKILQVIHQSLGLLVMIGGCSSHKQEFPLWHTICNGSYCTMLLRG